MGLQEEQGAHIYILTDLRTVERIRGASACTFQLLVRMYVQVWEEPGGRGSPWVGIGRWKVERNKEGKRNYRRMQELPMYV